MKTAALIPADDCGSHLHTHLCSDRGSAGLSGRYDHRAVDRKLPYDPANDIVSVALICSIPFALVVKSSLPVHSVADLIKLAKERPLSYGSAGTGSFTHLTAQLFSTAVGIKMAHLPYTGSAPALNALVAGHTQLMFTDLGPSLPLIRLGKLRALGITTAERAAAAPHIPPLGGSRCARLRRGRLGDADRAGEDATADPDRLNAEVNAIVNTAEVKQQLVNLGINPIGRGSLDELQAFVKAEAVRWGKVVQEAGLARLGVGSSAAPASIGIRPAAHLRLLSYRRFKRRGLSLVREYSSFVKFHRVEHYTVKWLLQCGGTPWTP